MVSVSTPMRWKNKMKKISLLSLAIGCLSVVWHPVWAQDVIKNTETVATDGLSPGGLSAQGNPKISVQCVPNSPAQQALDALLRAYEQGNVGFFQQRLDPAMIGFSNFINDLMTMNNAQRQTRLQVLDRQMQCGPDVAVIDFAWEKYYLDNVSFRPNVTRGRGSVLISGLGGGISGQWRISGLVGDTPFKPSFSDGSVVANPSVISFSSTPSGCVTALPSLTAVAALGAPVTAFPLASPPFLPNCLNPIGPLVVTCSVSVPGISPSVSGVASASLANPSCSASAIGAPVATVGVPLSYTLTGSQTISAAPGSTVTVNLPVTLSATATAASPPGQLAVASSASGTCTATIVVPSSTPLAAPTCTASPATLNASIEVRDADLTAPVVQVQVQASNGDSENFNLPKISAGVYRLTSLPITRGTARVQQNSGRIELVGASPSAVTLTIRYTDTKSSTGASVVRQASMTLVP